MISRLKIGPLVLIMVLLGCLAPSTMANAHEVRPAYLELSEVASGRFDVLLKTPMRGDARLSLDVGFSGHVKAISQVLSRPTDSAMLTTWQIEAVDPLPGQAVRIEGLSSTMTDALVRVVFLNGQEWTGRATPGAPAVIIPAVATGWSVAETYFGLGFSHILLGLDHILFVLTLILMAPNLRQLTFAITAFTVAHSITLAAAALGVVHVPPAPVEAAIALSIVFVALETLRAREGRHDIAARAPWIVAFAFGLLHGLGFAGALSAIGLPAGHIPLALLFFNLGVEAGQLVFVAVVLGLVAMLRSWTWSPPRWAGLIPPYAIGAIAMFWVFERVALF